MTNTSHNVIAARNPDPIIVTRAIIKRAWSDIEPKIASALASGAVSTGLVITLESYGIHLPLPVLSGLPVFCTILAGYLTPSVGTVTTVRAGDGLVVEKHGGNVEIKTGAIPIQPPSYVPVPQRDAAPDSASASAALYGVPRGTYVPPAPTPSPEPPADPEPYEVPDQARPGAGSTQGFTEVLTEDSPATSARWWPGSANLKSDGH